MMYWKKNGLNERTIDWMEKEWIESKNNRLTGRRMDWMKEEGLNEKRRDGMQEEWIEQKKRELNVWKMDHEKIKNGINKVEME